LAINGFAYVIMSFTGFLLTCNIQDKEFLIFQPALVGELALMLWLLIKGPRHGRQAFHWRPARAVLVPHEASFS
jgi:hypothetical protein